MVIRSIWRNLWVLLSGYILLIAMVAPLLAAPQPAAPAAGDAEIHKDKETLIATIERHPFVMRKGERLTGFSIELWREISQELGIKSRFVTLEKFGEMLDQTQKSKVDAAIANISITSKREKMMDFSQPIFDGGLQIAVPKTSGSLGLVSLLKAIWKSGLFELILMVCVVLLIAAHIMYWLETGDEKETFFDERYPQGMYDALWWAFVIITMGGFEDMRPKRRWSVVFAVFWIVTGLIATSIVISKITTALTVERLTSSISSHNDLLDKKVGVTRGSTAEAFLKKNGIPVIAYEKIQTLYADIKKRKLDAIVHDAPLLQYFVSHQGKNKVVLAGKVFKKEKYGIAFPEDSPLLESVNQTLLKLHENGRFDEISQRWFGSD